MSLYDIFLLLLNILISVQCALLVHTFLKMQQRTSDLNEPVFIINDYYAMTTYKHVKERWEASFKTPVLSKSTIFNLVSKFEVCTDFVREF